MQTALKALHSPAARIAARQHRTVMAVPSRRLHASPRCEAKPEKEAAPAPVEKQQQAVAPARSGLGVMDTWPSFGRMNQMFQEMEREMAQLSRAFGMPMPSMGHPSAAFADLPSLAADLPAALPPAARALAVDVKDVGSALEIVADVPGMSREDIKVQVSPDRVLTISGERKSEHKEGSEEEGTLRVERSYGSFMRRFRLPENVDVEGIKAVTKDGVLRLTVPKTEETKPKQIDVQVGGSDE